MKVKVLGSKKRFKLIYHISDIHIRPTERHVEYREVIGRLYSFLRRSIKNDLIVITGDIIHNRHNITSACKDLIIDFLVSLAEIAPVIIIPGNHDRSVKEPKALDFFDENLIKLDTYHPIYYLKYTGFYLCGNVLFGVTDIHTPNILRAQEIPKEYKNIEYKVALIHGYGSRTGLESAECITKGKFDGYHYVLLGDIHRYKYLDDDIAYAGSLIQQNYGELVENHGVLIWDLVNHESRLHEIHNNYGFVTVEVKEGKMNVPIDIPSKPRIRVIYTDTTKEQLQKVSDTLKSQYDVKDYREIESGCKDEPEIKPKKNANIVKYERREPLWSNQEDRMKFLHATKIDLKKDNILQEIIEDEEKFRRCYRIFYLYLTKDALDNQEYRDYLGNFPHIEKSVFQELKVIC